MTQTRGVFWFKRDLRLRDSPALVRALDDCREVTFLFLYEPSVVRAEETSAFHVRAWTSALEELDRTLRKAGHRMLVVEGEAVDILGRLHDRWSFARLYSHEEIGSNLTYARDRAVSRWCSQNEVEWIEQRQTGVFRPLVDRDRRARLWRSFMNDPERPAPDRERLRGVVPADIAALERLSFAARKRQAGLASPEGAGARMQAVSESRAWETLDSFLGSRAAGYSKGISSPNTAFVHGSRLSVHLAWGTITGRSVYQALEQRKVDLEGDDSAEAKMMRRSLTAFRSRLHWRDHFMQRLESETEMEFRALHPGFEEFPFEGIAHLEPWFRGVTGFPLVDACLRCAHGSGFLNFRMRCLITSTACHLLRIPWRSVMYPMARLWADYEPGIHISQLQMQAGMVGINTLRVYNPAKQAADNDPRCRFIKRWVPELRPFSVDKILDHQSTGTRLGEYPPPRVNYAETSQAIRKEYAAWKRRPEVRRSTPDVLLRHGSRKPLRNKKPRQATESGPASGRRRHSCPAT